MPEGEAHRHEPPIPHDEVKVDTRKNNAELEENKKPAPPAEAGAQEPNRGKEQGHAVEPENKQHNKVEEKPKPAEGVVRKEEVDLGGGEVLSNEVLEKQDAGQKKQDDPPVKKVEKLDPVKDPLPGNVAAAENQAAQAENVARGPDAAGKGEGLSRLSCKCNAARVEKLLEQNATMTCYIFSSFSSSS